MSTPVKAGTLRGIMGAEEHLARQEARKMVEALPPDHPLVQAAEDEKKRSGDIADLPDGHPLKVELAEAKARFDEQQAAKSKSEETHKVRKAKRISETKAFRDRIAKEEDERATRIESARVVNGAVDKSLASIDELLTVVRQNEEPFREDPFVRTRMARLERLAMAVRRGLVESRLSTMRMG